MLLLVVVPARLPGTGPPPAQGRGRISVDNRRVHVLPALAFSRPVERSCVVQVRTRGVARPHAPAAPLFELGPRFAYGVASATSQGARPRDSPYLATRTMIQPSAHTEHHIVARASTAPTPFPPRINGLRSHAFFSLGC